MRSYSFALPFRIDNDDLNVVFASCERFNVKFRWRIDVIAAGLDAFAVATNASRVALRLDRCARFQFRSRIL